MTEPRTTDPPRTALRALGRDTLRELTDRFELVVTDRRVLDQHVDALLGSAELDLADVLKVLKRDQLKVMCEALGLETTGREKQLYIDRILGARESTPGDSPPGDSTPGDSTPGDSTPAEKAEGARSVPPKSAYDRLIVRGDGDAGNSELEKQLWAAADELRANSKLKSSEYSGPVLGLIFLCFADHKFAAAEAEIGQASGGRRRRAVGALDYRARGVLYLPPAARFRQLLELPEGAEVGKAVNDAMRAIERDNKELQDVLPKTYHLLENRTLVELLKLMDSIPMDLEGDAFGKIYEYFLGKFAMSEGQKGGEFFTPTSIVKLIVNVIEPFHGRIFDPACGSGGMFVQSARFVAEHKRSPSSEISVYGQERVSETVRLCKMNLAVHGLSGDIREANTYYEDLHESVGRFDFVMANPPFNVDRVDKERLAGDPRFPFGMPKPDNANYLWIQHFYSALNARGRAGFVMANSASDARGSELEIRKKLIEEKVVDVVISIAPNFFYTVTLPCTLWFLDRGKKGTDREDQVLFIDARNVYRQVDRAHRDFTPELGEFLANVVRLYRKEETKNLHGSSRFVDLFFPERRYVNVPGLCATSDVSEIQALSLNPGRYIGTIPEGDADLDFFDQLHELHNKFDRLTAEARFLESEISSSVMQLLRTHGA